MKLTFLGTSAGEGYPGLWCDCPHCRYAREHGGHNIRQNSCALVDDALLLDMGIACFDSALRSGVSLKAVRALLVTHPHEDHFYPQHLYWRNARAENFALPFTELMQQGGPRFSPIPDMTIYGNVDTEALVAPLLSDAENNGLRFVRIAEGQAFVQDGYTVTPIRGNHGPRGFAHSYVIEKDGRKMLYALDTGYYDDDMLALLSQHTFHLIVMEGTGGLNDIGEGHMCLKKNVVMRDFFIKHGCYASDARFVLTHLSPHWTPPHDIYRDIALREGMVVAYDGMEIEV